MVRLTRRELVAGSLAATVLAAKNRIDAGRVSVLTDEAGASPAEAIAFAKQYGLKWVELRGVPGGKASYAYLPEPELKAAALELADNGLRVSFLNTSLLKFPLPGTEPVRRSPESPEARARRIQDAEARFARRLDDLAEALRAAHVFGVSLVRVFTFSRVQDPSAVLPRVAGILAEMAEIAGRQKVRLLVENEGSCNVTTCREMAELMSRVPSRWLGINWDALNGASQKEVPFPDGYRLLSAKRIGNVQVKGRSVLQGPQRLDWPAILEVLERDGYRGCVGLETHTAFPQTKQLEDSHASMREILRLVERS